MAVASSLGGAAVGTHAQNAAEDDAQRATAAPQTIMVTATRRPEPARDVPVAVTSLDADALQASGAKTLSDWVALEPGINYGRRNTAGRGDLGIRGVNASRQNGATVGVFVDDVPIGSANGYGDGTNAFDQRLLDLDRIEILKGPQGTLYGASSMGGLLKYVTATPDSSRIGGNAGFDLAASAHGGWGWSARAVLNAPLAIGDAGLRIAAYDERSAGYIDAVGPAGGVDINGGRARGGRVALLARPARGVTIRIAGQTQSSRSDGADLVDYDITNSRPAAQDLTRLDLRVSEPKHQENQLLSATVDIDLGSVRLSSITGRQRLRFRSTGDYSTVYGTFLPTLVTAFDSFRTDTRKTTQELRLVSTSQHDLQWIAGLFYADEASVVAQDLYQTTTLQSDPAANPLIIGPAAGFTTDYSEAALYATGTWQATERLALTAGARAASYRSEVLQRDGGLFARNRDSRGSSNDTTTTYLLAARLRLDAQAGIYARAASGFRPGGPNLSTLTVTGEPLPAEPRYRSDSLWSYELGYKGGWRDGRGSMELALYQTDWRDMQVVGFLAGASFRSNAGAARIRGMEGSARLQPTDRLTLAASMSLIDARLTQAAPIGAETVASGTRLPKSARVGLNLSARQAFAFAGWPARVAATAAYVGARNSNFPGLESAPNYRLPAFTQLDLDADVSCGDTIVGLFVRNANDARGQLNADTTQTPFGGPTLVSVTRPRTIGLALTVPF